MKSTWETDPNVCPLDISFIGTWTSQVIGGPKTWKELLGTPSVLLVHHPAEDVQFQFYPFVSLIWIANPYGPTDGPIESNLCLPHY